MSKVLIQAPDRGQKGLYIMKDTKDTMNGFILDTPYKFDNKTYTHMESLMKAVSDYAKNHYEDWINDVDFMPDGFNKDKLCTPLEMRKECRSYPPEFMDSVNSIDFFYGYLRSCVMYDMEHA